MDSRPIGEAVNPQPPSPPQAISPPPTPLLQDSKGSQDFLSGFSLGIPDLSPGVGFGGGYRNIPLLKTVSLAMALPFGTLPRPGLFEGKMSLVFV